MIESKASIFGAVGGVPLGCLDCSNFHVSSVLNTCGGEGFACFGIQSLFLARDMAVSILCLALRCLE